MPQLIGYHTCLQTGGKDIVLRDGPYYSTGKQKDGSVVIPFLGKGYYFWQETDKMEHSSNWGYTHCRNKYYVMKCVIKSENSHGKCTLLDLLGNIDHREYFRKKIEFAKGRLGGKLKISQIIDLLQRIDKKESASHFPFNIVRAPNDNIYVGKDGIEFSTNPLLKGYINIMREKWVICLYGQKSVHLLNRTIVKENP